MALEIRTITSDEVEQAHVISLQAFGNAERLNPAASVEQAKSFYQPDWHLASFEDGEMTSMMRILPFAMRINGRGMPFGAVSPVANSPLHRRKGHTGAMLRQSLALMRERGQWLSGLYTPHPAFYRRYGWEIAADERQYSFKPKDCQLTARPSERGRLREIAPADWQQLDAVYRRWSTLRNGPLQRPEVWWRNSVLGESGPRRNEAVLWETSAGEPQGYAVFNQSSNEDGSGTVWTREFAALSGDAYLNLITFLAQHDIHREITVVASSDDPLPLLFSDAERLTVKQGYTVLLRIVDVEGALRSRPVAHPDLDTELTLEVTDEAAPWNAGTWRVSVESGSVVVDRSDGAGDLQARREGAGAQCSTAT